MTQTRRGPVSATGPATNINDIHIVQPQRRLLPVAPVYVAAPCDRRDLPLIVALDCPCLGIHTYRTRDEAALLDGRLVRRCPATGQRFRLLPVEVRPVRAEGAGVAA